MSKQQEIDPNWESKPFKEEHTVTYKVNWKTYIPIFETAKELHAHAKFISSIRNDPKTEKNSLNSKIAEGELLCEAAIWEPAQAFASFAFEAYLNHVGIHDVKFWEEMEKTLSWEMKLSVLGSQLGKHFKSFKEFSDVKALFKHRDSLAHGKTVRTDFSVSHDSYQSVMKSNPSQLIREKVGWGATNSATIETRIAAVEELIRIINSHRLIPDQGLFEQNPQTVNYNMRLDRSPYKE